MSGGSPMPSSGRSGMGLRRRAGRRSSALPPVPDWAGGWQLGARSVVRMPEVPVRPTARTFRTFVIPIPVSASRYVRAIEFRPDNARVVHHANLGVDRTRSSRQLDARDPEVGYAGSMERDARYPKDNCSDGRRAGAASQPDGTQAARAGQRSGCSCTCSRPENRTRRRTVGFFTDGADLHFVGLRPAATIDIPPGTEDYIVADRYRLPVDVELLAVQPHAHNSRGGWKRPPSSLTAPRAG